MASNRILVSSDFRAGVIYATTNQYHRVFPTVDIAVIDDGHVLVGRKQNRQEFCFPGGFVDLEDGRLEEAAAREAWEETGIQLLEDNLEYVCSRQVNDWRYRHRDDGQIMTTLFASILRRPQSGKAGDDLDEVHWLRIEDLAIERMVKGHQPLMAEIVKKYGHLKSKGEKTV
jgi:bifunctional NMN adenylyltransferase/nudix hydrolase